MSFIMRPIRFASTGHIIEGSGLFDGSTGYLKRTMSTPTNNKIFTISMITKLNDDTGTLFFGGTNFSSNFDTFQYSSDMLDFQMYHSSSIVGRIRTTQLLRDPSAYYHIILAVNTSTGISGTNKLRMYINGVEVTDFETDTNPSNDQACFINSAVEHDIGSGLGNYYCPMYCANVTFIDGLQLDPTSFGEVTDDGFWQINDVSGLDFGDNGFLLTGGSAISAGTDSSGNSNNFSKTGSIISTSDSPTSGGDDNEYGNYATLNPLDPPGVTISEGNLKFSHAATTYRAARGTMTVPQTGQWVYRFTVGANIGSSARLFAGFCFPGDDIKTNAPFVGNANSVAAVGVTEGSIRIGTTTQGTTTTAWATNDVIELFIDRDAQEIKAFQNGSQIGNTVTYSDTTAIFDEPNVQVYGGVYGTNNATLDFGGSGFTPTLSGYSYLSTANLPTPAIINPDDHFHSQIVAKSGTTTTFTLPDWITTYEYLIIIKNISGSAEKWYWLNSLRGVNKYISSDATTAETTDANVYSRSGTTGTLGSTLTSGKSYLIEIHKAGLASATASNTTGSINTVATSANTLSGFALVEYIGNQTAGATIAHGLSVAPEYLFCKQMNASDGNLDVFHVSLGGTKRLFLQTTAAVNTSAAAWNNTAPSSSVITLGDGFGTNKNTVTYMAYVWHGVDGYSSFGSYEGNGNADGAFINTGFAASTRFVKNIDAVEDWPVFDKSFSPSNVVGHRVSYNRNIALDTGSGGHHDIVSNGAKQRNSDTLMNGAATYIYGAWGGQPMTDGAINQGRAR